MKNKGRLVALIVILSLLAIAPGFLMVYISRDAAEKNPASSTTAVYSEEKATNSVPAVEWQRQVTEMEYTTVSVLLPPGMEIRKEDDGVNHRIYLDHDLLPEEYKDIFASFDLICGRADSFAPINREAFMEQIPTIKAGAILEEDIVFTLAEDLGFQPWTYRYANYYRLENLGSLGVAYGYGLVAVYPEGFSLHFVIDTDLSDAEFQQRRELLETIFESVEFL